MRWPKFRRAMDATEVDLVEETAAEPVPVAAVEVENRVDEATDVDDPDPGDPPTRARRRVRLSGAIAFLVLPVLAILLASAAGYLKYYESSIGGIQLAQRDSVQSATDGTIALLSYMPDTVEKDLEAAKSRLTGEFLDAYTSLTHDVVIPGAKQKQISAKATVPAASLTSATENRAVVLLFVNQAVVVGQDAPTDTASSVRVTLDKVDGRWLISQFEPV
jgi:Mce-associated membrane protein